MPKPCCPNGGGGILALVVGADGMRIEKVVNGETVAHIWDGSNIVMDVDGDDGAVIDRYIRGITLLASEDYGYYLFNAHGDVVQLADGSGVVEKDYDYDAFGVQVDSDGQTVYTQSGDALFEDSDTNPWRYCGEYFDTETNTIYLRARYYDPVTGRFSSEDPIRDGLNWYTYCANNPILYVDPLGTDYYVYYGSDQGWAAQQYEKQLKKDYKDVPIHMIFVKNPDVFYERWEAMGIENGNEVTIDGVIINLHGNPTNFYASDGTAIDLSQTSNERSLSTLLLLVCNAGNVDYDNNVAVQFLKAFNIGNVIAPDGYHWRHEFYGIFGIGANVKNSVSKYDKEGNTHFKNSDRGSYGFVSFSLNGLGQVAYNFDVLDSINGGKIRAADLFKHKHYFAGGAKGLR